MDLTTLGNGPALATWLNQNYPLTGIGTWEYRSVFNANNPNDPKGTYDDSIGINTPGRFYDGVQASGLTEDQSFRLICGAFDPAEMYKWIIGIKSNLFNFFLSRCPVAWQTAYSEAKRLGDKDAETKIAAKVSEIAARGGFVSDDYNFICPVPQKPQVIAPAITANDVDAVSAVATVKTFLSDNYALPTDWDFVVSASVSSDTNLETGGQITNCILEAKACYQGPGADRPDVPAGRVTVSSQNYPAPWVECAKEFPSVAKPVYLNTVQACRWEDAIATPQIQAAGSSAPALPPPAPIHTTEQTPDASQGYDSSGQAPWDAQPDVMPAVSEPVVSGVVVDAGYKSTFSQMKSDPAFLNWLNLKIPDATQVKSILANEMLLGEYYSQYGDTLTVVSTGKTSPTIDSFNKAELLDDPLKPNYSDQSFGNGVLPSNNTINTGNFTQQPPQNQKTTDIVATETDGVSMMLNQRSSDFLNMIGEQYFETLLTVSRNSKARSDLNALIDKNDMAGVENFLRNFDASAYATATSTQDDTPVVTPAEDSTKNMLIAGGVLLGILLFAVLRKG